MPDKTRRTKSHTHRQSRIQNYPESQSIHSNGNSPPKFAHSIDKSENELQLRSQKTLVVDEKSQRTLYRLELGHRGPTCPQRLVVQDGLGKFSVAGTQKQPPKMPTKEEKTHVKITLHLGRSKLAGSARNQFGCNWLTCKTKALWTLIQRLKADFCKLPSSTYRK